MALKDIGFSSAIVFRNHRAVSVQTLLTSEAVLRRHGSGGFDVDANGVQPVHVAIVNKFRHFRQPTSADTQACGK